MAENTTETADTSTEAVEETAAAEATAADTGQDTKGDAAADEKKDEGKDLIERSELNKVAALRNEERRKRQEAETKTKELTAKLEEIQRGNEGETEKAQREAAEKATADTIARYKPIIVRKEATAQLMEAGFSGGNIKQFVDLVKLDEVEIDDDGTVTGIDDQVAVLKDDFPNLFGGGQEKPRPKSARAADGADKPPAKKKLSAEEQMLVKLGRR